MQFVRFAGKDKGGDILNITKLMKIQPRTIKHEKFKEMVKDWLDTHREEYCAFAEEVSKRGRSDFQHIYFYTHSLPLPDLPVW